MNFLVSTVIISEVMANPDGTDAGKEWIELANRTEQTIQLEDWEISTGKKSHTLTGQILPDSIKTVENLNITLKNSNGMLILADQNGNIIDEIQYDKAPSGQSLQRIVITNGQKEKHDQSWTNPTKNLPNPTLFEIRGIITKEPQIDEDFYFELEAQAKSHKITFEEDFDFNFLKSTLTKGSSIVVLVNENYDLLDFSILEQAVPDETQTQKINWQNYLLFPISILGLVLYWVYNKSAASIDS
jgi:lamin tail-like protein